MKSTMKRALSLVLTALMLLMLLPGSMAEEMNTASAPVIPGLSDGGALVSEVLGESAEKTAAELLYDRLMACETIDEINAMLDGLTEEENALLDQFTDEQNAALEAKVEELGGYEINDLGNYSVTIVAGSSGTVNVSSVNDGKFSSNTTGITGSYNNGTVTINVADTVEAGTYKVYVTQQSAGGRPSTSSNVHTISVTVVKTLTVTNTMTKAEVAYVLIDKNTTSTSKFSFVSVSSDTPVSLSLPTEKDAIVFFVKPAEDNLLTQFYRSDSIGTDLYSVDIAAENSLFQFFKNNSGIGNAIIKEAKDNGYLGYYGFTGVTKIDYKAPFVEVAEAPEMSVKVTATPDKDLKPNDTVTFNIEVVPGDLSTGVNYTIKDKKITTLTVNGVAYSPTENSDGTYSVSYQITQEDWLAQKTTINVTASLTYDYSVSIQDRNNKVSYINTIRTISSSAEASCDFATKQGVVYQVKFNPEDKAASVTGFGDVPVDEDEYFENDVVTVNSDYGKTPVDDPTNGGTWTFDGWYNGTEKVGDTLTMGTSNILLVGTWTFTPYPTTEVTIKKIVTGNMGEWGKDFTFTAYVRKTGSNTNEAIDWKTDDTDYNYTLDSNNEISFSLKNDGYVTLHGVPIGATLTITETNADGYKTYISTVDNGKTEVVSKSAEYIVTNDSKQTITFTNDKTATPDTGVLLDSLPYLLILAVVVIVIVLSILRKRRNDD